MNVPLLREIQVKILTAPELLEMGDWHTNKNCGTAHCIGGWAQVLSGKEMSHATAENDAKNLLDISWAQAERLFFVTGAECWPIQFQGVVNAWEPTPQQAVDRIEHFIKTEGRE